PPKGQECCPLAEGEPMTAERLVGNWKLVSWQVVTEDGAKDLFGSKQNGYLIVTREGRAMTVTTAEGDFVFYILAALQGQCALVTDRVIPLAYRRRRHEDVVDGFLGACVRAGAGGADNGAEPGAA